MLLRAPSISVDSDDPFANDVLGRRQVADSMTELAKSAASGLVVSLHGPWGSGKSTFLSMWRHQLSSAGFRTLSFNAWETDIAEDAMVALLGELEVGLLNAKSASATGSVALRNAIKKAKKIGGKLVRSALPSAIRLATAGLVDLDDLSEEIVSEWSGKLAEEQVAAYESARRSVQSFRDSISEIAKTTSNTEPPSLGFPLVFIVDELDRCRPTYAVRVLECIKHFFAVPGVMFVLAVDAEQLSHSIRSQYGQGMDAGGYLRRFFDLELTLPEPTGDKFSRALFARFEIEKIFVDRRTASPSNEHDQPLLLETFEGLFRLFRCSLRDRERCFSVLSFALRSTPKDYLLHPDVLATLIVVKIKDPTTYFKISSETRDVKQILQAISSQPGGARFFESTRGEWLQAGLYAVFNREIWDVAQRLQRASDLIADESEKNRTNRLIGFLGDREVRGMAGSLDYLLGKIDLVSAKQ